VFEVTMKWNPTMRLESDAVDGNRLVFVAWNAPVLDLLSTEETHRFNCGGCGSVLGIRMWPDAGNRLAFKCPTCGHLTQAEDSIPELALAVAPA